MVTKEINKNVEEYLEAIKSESKKEDSRVLMKLKKDGSGFSLRYEVITF